jgi:hypothetical protein
MLLTYQHVLSQKWGDLICKWLALAPRMAYIAAGLFAGMRMKLQRNKHCDFRA